VLQTFSNIQVQHLEPTSGHPVMVNFACSLSLSPRRSQEKELKPSAVTKGLVVRCCFKAPVISKATFNVGTILMLAMLAMLV
jgi:hypothetical protein